MIKLKDFLETRFGQFIKFGIVGISNTLVNYIVYVILIKLNMHYLAASVIGFFVSVVNAYYWNNKYVFKAENKSKRTIIKVFFKTFISYAGTGLVLNNILLVVWVDLLGINQMLSPIVNLIITIPLNFVLNKYWAFHEKNI